MISLQEAIRHPVTIVSSGLAAASQLFQIPFIDALVAVVWTQISVIFTSVSVFAFTVLPNIDLGRFAFLTSSVRTLALVLAVVYAAKLAYQAYKSFDNRLDNQ
jgi:hypothetical protein